MAHLRACHGKSERRPCHVIDIDRKSVRFRSTRDDDADLREKLRELANQRRRFGYRRLHILLRRGEDYNQERPHSSLGYATPAAFAAELDKQWPDSLTATCLRSTQLPLRLQNFRP